MPTAAKPQNHSLPIIPKNKKEVREQERTGNYVTPDNPRGNAKVAVIGALIEYTTMAVQWYANSADQDDVNKAKKQSTGAAGVLSVMQSEINKGPKSLIPAKYLNQNSLNLMANYLLNGKEISNSTFTGVDQDLKSVADKLLPAIYAARMASLPAPEQPTYKDNTNVIKTVPIIKPN